MEDSTIVNGDIPVGAKQDQCSLDLEAGSHDHNHALAKHSNKKTVNGLFYRKLLEKEELEDSEENTIVMEDDAVDESSVTIKHKSGKLSDFIVKVKLVKSQITSTFRILLGLVK